MTKTTTNNQAKQKQFKPAILQKIFASKTLSSENSRKPNTSPYAGLSIQSPVISQDAKRDRFKKNPKKVVSQSTLPSGSNENKTSRLSSTKQKAESQVEKMRNRLSVGQFRFISEQLYTQTSSDSGTLFNERPELFYAYQRGYSRQQRTWPSNPLDAIISELQQEIKLMNECGSSSKLVVADFGCGEARLARTILSGPEDYENVVINSFDFVAANDHVVACDMAHTKLDTSSVDIAVFCLSLMGTNVSDFLLEANRVLKSGGRLRVAEVRSRFESVPKFIKKLKGFGFKLTELRGTDASSFFTHFTFVKVSSAKKGNFTVKLAPCIYKKR